ncbi:MAG: AAA family ATPase [Burkholderiales bacterium]|nr:AAA family ATPase [Burkholderiales bacterium]
MADTAKAFDALHSIPPDLPREDWVRAGMAAQAAGLDFETFDAWSAAGGSYDARAARDTWRSFKAGEGVGAGTLYRMAAEHGWRMGSGKPQRETRAKTTTRPTAPSHKPATGMAAADVWARCEPATCAHPYIVSKGAAGVPLDGLRVVPAGDPLTIQGERMAGALVIPVIRTDGTLSSLQFIALPEVSARLKAKGKPGKLNLPGASMEGWFAVGERVPGGVAYLCEGIGQAWACWQATGAAAVVCFGWGRVRGVAKALRQRDPLARLVLVPDVGKESDAHKIASELHASVAAMPDGWPDNSDVSDFAQSEGRDALELLLSNAYTPAPPTPDGVVLARGDSLTPEPVRWLWPGWLALGKLAILAGAPGTGKTTCALNMAATVTVGGQWPNGSRCPAGDVLVWSGEDDPADTLLPRLIAAGADRSRVFFVGDTVQGGQRRPFDPSTDTLALLTAASKLPALRFILVDPVVSAISGDSHKNTEVRRGMQPLVDFAAAAGAALVGITHFSKGGQGQDPAQRVVGSIAFTAVARVVLVCAKVKDDDGAERRILARSKSNIGPDDGGFAYTLEQCEALPGIWTSRTVWGESVAGSARDLLAEPDESREAEGPSGAAAEFLRERLALGTCPSKTIKGEAEEAGFAWRTVQRAADRLGVMRKKSGMTGGWYWSLPTLKAPGFSPEDATFTPEGAEDATF